MFYSLKAMMKDRLVSRLGRCGVVALLMLGSILGCQSADQAVEASSSQHYERGPHGGRILRDGDIAVEIKIYEAGTPPRFRVYGFKSGRPINPNELSGNILLKRLGGELEDFILEPIQRPAESDVGDLFLGNSKDVKEPHSFDLNISLNYQGKKYSWSYPSYEYRTVIPADVASDAGLKFEKATSREISSTRRLRGKVTPSEHRVAHVIPRFAGVVREGRKHIGDSVEKGEVMAIIESNQSF